MSRDDYTNWYPRFKYQRQAIQNIIMTGPAVARGDYAKNIQAKMKYTFHFKWGGNSSPQETVFDPVNQPVTPVPNHINLNNEIIDPRTSITGEIYPWDFRRDMLTATAAERIKESLSSDFSLFTDGDHQEQISQETPQTKEAQKTQTEALLLQLHQLKQYNMYLEQRFRKLKQSLEDL